VDAVAEAETVEDEEWEADSAAHEEAEAADLDVAVDSVEATAAAADIAGDDQAGIDMAMTEDTAGTKIRVATETAEGMATSMATVATTIPGPCPAVTAVAHRSNCIIIEAASCVLAL